MVRHHHEIIRKRCPKCKGIGIYHRINWNKKDVKPYTCWSCGNEFDVPFFGPKRDKRIVPKLGE